MSEQMKLLDSDERIALIDGAPWIHNQIEFHGLTDDIGLDFYYLQEDAQKARRGLFGEESVKVNAGSANWCTPSSTTATMPPGKGWTQLTNRCGA